MIELAQATDLVVGSFKYEALFNSDYFSIHEFVSHAGKRVHFKNKITTQFCINLPRSGYFSYHAYRQDLEEHHSRVLIEKPGTEFELIQEAAGIGSCTVIHFTDAGVNAIKNSFPYKRFSFFNDEDSLCSMFSLSPAAEYLHARLLEYFRQAVICNLQIELLVFELLEHIFSQMNTVTISSKISEKLKSNHLLLVENAKFHLYQCISSEISLSELARHCCASPFHLARIFKQVCGYSPFYYLQQIRLKFAESLLVSTELPIMDICYRSGFTRLDYFSTVFSKQFYLPPSKYKVLHKRKP